MAVGIRCKPFKDRVSSFERESNLDYGAGHVSLGSGCSLLDNLNGGTK